MRHGPGDAVRIRRPNGRRPGADGPPLRLRPDPSAFTNQLDTLAGAAGGDTRKTAAIAGNASRFDPVAALDQVLALAGPGARLAELRTAGVRSDGTLDLTATYTPAPRASYMLHREVPAPADAQPLGAGGSCDGR